MGRVPQQMMFGNELRKVINRGVIVNAAQHVLSGGLAIAGPDKIAIVSDEESVSYGELVVRVSRYGVARRRDASR